MFIHSLKYSLKTLFRNKSLIFWTYIFPLILGTFFYLAFSNITESEKLDVIDIAIVNNEDFINNEAFKKTFESLSEDGEEKVFNIEYVDEEEAKELLDNDEVIGYMKLNDNKPVLTFLNNGVDQTIFKYVVEEIMETSKIFNEIYEDKIRYEISYGKNNIDYESVSKEILEVIKNEYDVTNDRSSNNLDYVMIEFYTLIAMTCMYGGIISMTSINQKLANMDKKGKRVSISSTKKRVIILSSLVASYIVQLIGLILLFLFMYFILHVDFGNNFLLVILLALVGTLAGLSLGIAVGTLLKSSENAKTGILLAITMTGCFFSGMFGITMKYLIDSKFPLINKINPVSMITDGFYSLYYYDTYNRYYFNIISLIVFSILLLIVSIFGLRRQKYDSI